MAGLDDQRAATARPPRPRDSRTSAAPDSLSDSMMPASLAVTIPSATFCSTAWARTSLSASAALSAVIDPSERSSSSERADELEEGRHLGPQHPGEDRREDEVDGAAGVRRRGLQLVAAEGGQEDDRGELRLGPQPDQLRRLVAVQGRHPHVHHDHGEALADDGLEGGALGAGLDHPVTERREHRAERPAVRRVGVDDEDGACLRFRHASDLSVVDRCGGVSSEFTQEVPRGQTAASSMGLKA